MMRMFLLLQKLLCLKKALLPILVVPFVYYCMSIISFKNTILLRTYTGFLVILKIHGQHNLYLGIGNLLAVWGENFLTVMMAGSLFLVGLAKWNLKLGFRKMFLPVNQVSQQENLRKNLLEVMGVFGVSIWHQKIIHWSLQQVWMRGSLQHWMWRDPCLTCLDQTLQNCNLPFQNKPWYRKRCLKNLASQKWFRNLLCHPQDLRWQCRNMQCPPLNLRW